MPKPGDEAILAIMGGPKRSPIGRGLSSRRPKPKMGLAIEFGGKPKKEESMDDMGEMDDEGEDVEAGDEDREMYVADLDQALRTRDADALYDAIKAIAMNCMQYSG